MSAHDEHPLEGLEAGARTVALAAVESIHGRYQREIVESLNVCPFARKSRELGRVHRPVYFGAEHPAPATVAADLLALDRAHPDAEIVLLTFPCGGSHPWSRPANFEAFLSELRTAWADLHPPRAWYMVAFHPNHRRSDGRARTQDNLVPDLRRSPDPVIQCVNAEVLDQVRREAQRVAHERMRKELEATHPELVELFARSVQPDPELSADIARANFENLGDDGGFARLGLALADIHAARDLAYAPLDPRLALAGLYDGARENGAAAEEGDDPEAG